jgi:hypothetical protein
MSERDLQVAYIDKDVVWGQPGKAGFILKKYIIENINSDAYGLSCNIIKAFRDDVHELCIDKWCNKAYDRLISEIDWSTLSQCQYCHKYYNPAEVWYGTGDDFDSNIFCSGDCAAIHKDDVKAGRVDGIDEDR